MFYLATHGEDINDIIDNILQMIWTRLKKRAEEVKRQQKLKEELNLSKPIQSDLSNNIKDKISKKSHEGNIEDYRKIERAILEYELKKKSGHIPSKDEKDEYLLNNFKKDIYLAELKLTPQEQIEIRQDILETINDKRINNELLREETINNVQEIDDLIKQEEILNTDLASQILSEIQQNKELLGSLSDSIKSEASNNISMLNKSYNDLTKSVSKTPNVSVNRKSEISHTVNGIGSATDKIQSKENEITKEEKEVEKEVEFEIER